MTTFALMHDHWVTKLAALRLFLRGNRGAARTAWRWMANRPNAQDLEQARRDIARPHVAAAIARLRTAQ